MATWNWVVKSSVCWPGLSMGMLTLPGIAVTLFPLGSVTSTVHCSPSWDALSPALTTTH
jgi:hypothetical protein